MMATSNTTRAAMNAGMCRGERMSFSGSSMPTMCMSMTAAASVIIIGTGVLTSVPLFIVVLLVASLLVTLVVLISLLLTGLTRLVGLESLVGLTKKVATRTVRGD